MSILKPWTPVGAQKTNDGYEISVLGRKYALSEKSPFFSSVVSKGEELLASPMRIVAENKGIVQEFCKTKKHLLPMNKTLARQLRRRGLSLSLYPARYETRRPFARRHLCRFYRENWQKKTKTKK